MPTFQILTPEELAIRDAEQQSKSARTRALMQEQKPEPVPVDVQARMAYDAEQDPDRRWLAAFKVAIKGNLSPSQAAHVANNVAQATTTAATNTQVSTTVQ